MLEGETVIPAGKPVACTVTAEVNPFNGVASKDNDTEPPPVNGAGDGVTDKLKSPIGPPPPPLFPPPPPQPASPAITRREAKARKSTRSPTFEDESMIKGTRFLYYSDIIQRYGVASIEDS